MKAVPEDRVVCPHCKKRLIEPHYKTFSGMRLIREVNGKNLYEVRCHLCGCVFDVAPSKPRSKKPVRHMVTNFVGGYGKTKCGIYSTEVVAYSHEVTCKRCRKALGLPV